MIVEWLRNILPRGLYGRAALLILAPIITLQMILSVSFVQRHYEGVTRQMTQNTALELKLFLDNVATAGTLKKAQTGVAHLSDLLEIEVKFPVSESPNIDSRSFFDISGRVLIQTARENITQVIAIDLKTDKHWVYIWVKSHHGRILFTVNRSRVSASNPHQFLILSFFVGLLISIAAILFLQDQVRPIRELAKASSEFGKGRAVGFKPSGAIEVRLAGNAFLKMRARIENQIEQRTIMLSGIGHDLRTPLTRLKLSLSMFDNSEEAEEMSRDVEDMEKLTDQFLSFVREDALEEPVESDPIALVKAIIKNAARLGQDVSLETVEGHGQVLLHPAAVTRALENLTGNALRHGNRCRISVLILNTEVRFSVEDDGPGIPPELREKAMRPFVQLDEARNQNNGISVGLGLSITSDIAKSHGGSLQLGESKKLGGLKADLIVPR